MGIQEALIAAVQAMEAQHIPYKKAARLFKRQMVYSAVNRRKGNISCAARDLGVTTQLVNLTIRQDAKEHIGEAQP